MKKIVDETSVQLVVIRTSSSKGYVVLVNAEFPKGKRIDCASVPVKFKDGAEHFVAVIRGESEVDPLCSLELNILVQEVSTAGYQSIAQKREISLS